MSDPYIGEIRLVPFTFAPQGWAFCNGQLLNIAQYSALYAVIGIFYGGDGRTNFALPNLQGRVPIHQGQGPALSPRTVGSTGGAQTATLTDVPTHTHTALAASGSGPTSPAGATWGSQAGRNPPPTYFNGNPNTTMSPQALLAAGGGGAAHNNMQPYLTLNFVIALVGLFPSRG
jgi:microcystin-dependent protein